MKDMLKSGERTQYYHSVAFAKKVFAGHCVSVCMRKNHLNPYIHHYFFLSIYQRFIKTSI